MKKSLSPLMAMMAMAAMIALAAIISLVSLGCSSNSGGGGEDAPVEPPRVTLSQASVTLSRGDTAILSATVQPSSPANNALVWDQSTPSVATVDQNGIVYAHSRGDCIISVRSAGGGQPAFCNVRVITPIAALTMMPGIVMNLDMNDPYDYEQYLRVAISPIDASDQSVVWSIERIIGDPVYVYVPGGELGQPTASLEVRVRALGTGSAIVRVRAASDESLAAFCTVTVTGPNFGVEGVSLSKASLLMVVGDSERLTATVRPDYATDKNVIWDTSDPSVATVDQNGLVYAAGPGMAAISVTTVDKGYYAECAVEVKTDIYATTLMLNQSSISMLSGESQALTVALLPSNSTNRGEVTWASSNQSVATVHPQTGAISAHAPGQAIITARTDDHSDEGFPSVWASCMVTVQSLYVAGYTVNAAGLSSAQVWMNGAAEAPLSFSGKNAEANAVYVVGYNVYVAGYEENDLGLPVATVWRDGNLLSALSSNINRAAANDIFVDGNNVFVVGYEDNDPQIPVATLWQNGNLHSRLTNGGGKAEARSVFVSGNSVYTAGYDTNIQGISVAYFWKDGSFRFLENNGSLSAAANSIYVHGNDVYIAGWEEDGNGDHFAVLWKNGDADKTMLGRGKANCVHVAANGDVYVAGYEINAQGIFVATVWQNGRPQSLSNGGTNSAANSVCVSGSNVYVVGYENGSDGKPEAKMWKDGYATILGANSVANSVAIR